MEGSFNFDAVMEEVAERAVVKALKRVQEDGALVRPRLLSVKQAAVYLGRTEEAVQHMISNGKLSPVRSDRRVFIDVRDLDAWIEDNKQRGIV